MKDLGRFIQYDLNDANDCMDLVDKHGFTNSDIKNYKAQGNGWLTVAKEED